MSVRTRCQINRFVLQPISAVTTLPGISLTQGTEPSIDWQISATVREIRLNYSYFWWGPSKLSIFSSAERGTDVPARILQACWGILWFNELKSLAGYHAGTKELLGAQWSWRLIQTIQKNGTYTVLKPIRQHTSDLDTALTRLQRVSLR